MAIPTLLILVFVIGTLCLGMAIPTEFSVMADAYALVIGGLIYRDLTLRAIWSALIETAVMTGAVMPITMTSSAFQWLLTAERVPQNLAIRVTATISGPWTIIMALNLVILVMGAFLDPLAAILLLGPLFMGIGQAIGLDPAQLGLMMVVNLLIGLYTPMQQPSPVRQARASASCWRARAAIQSAMRATIRQFM